MSHDVMMGDLAQPITPLVCQGCGSTYSREELSVGWGFRATCNCQLCCCFVVRRQKTEDKTFTKSHTKSNKCLNGYKECPNCNHTFTDTEQQKIFTIYSHLYSGNQIKINYHDTETILENINSLNELQRVIASDPRWEILIPDQILFDESYFPLLVRSISPGLMIVSETN
jgi:hypothetical protein